MSLCGGFSADIVLSIVMLSALHSPESCSAEFCYSECHYAMCRQGISRGAMERLRKDLSFSIRANICFSNVFFSKSLYFIANCSAKISFYFSKHILTLQTLTQSVNPCSCTSQVKRGVFLGY